MGILEKFRQSQAEAVAAAPAPSTSDGSRGEADIEEPSDPLLELKHRVHDRMLKEVDPHKITAGDPAVRRSVEETAGNMLNDALAEDGTALSRSERMSVISDVADEMLGLGPIEKLIQDPTISEVMVNAPNRVYFERAGLIYLSNRMFRDTEHIMRIIDKITIPLGRRVDESSPMVDARLPDGSRVNAIIPPLALTSPSVTIRKFSRDPFTMDDLIAFGTLSPYFARYCEAVIKGRMNIIVSGGTGTGKTTFLNVLSDFIPKRERIVTIEDPAELQLRQPHVVRLETRPPNMEGKGQVTQRDLVRNALRMRPDRIIVGEVRSGEAFDMLQAMNTGHEGSLTTVHSNTPRDALSRIENMVLMANLDLPVRAVREQLASAVNLIIHLQRHQDGVRRVVDVTEIVGMEGQVVTLQDLFRFEYAGLDRDGKVRGELKPTGIRATFVERLEQRGIELPTGAFGD